MTHSDVHLNSFCVAQDDEWHVPIDADADVRVELITVSHSTAATRPSRWSAILITKDAAPHSKYLRSIVDSMLDGVVTVDMSPAVSGSSTPSLPSSLKVEDFQKTLVPRCSAIVSRYLTCYCWFVFIKQSII